MRDPYRPLKTPPTPWPQVYLCVGLHHHGDSAAGARADAHLSVVFYYHFAFLAISIRFRPGAGASSL